MRKEEWKRCAERLPNGIVRDMPSCSGSAGQRFMPGFDLVIGGHSDPVFLGVIVIGAVAQVFKPSQREVSVGSQDPSLIPAGEGKGIFPEEADGVAEGEGGLREGLPVEDQ